MHRFTSNRVFTSMSYHYLSINLHRLFYFLLLICCISVSAQAQHTNHNQMFWTETVISGKIKGKFRYQLDYQYRRQGISEDTRTQMTFNHVSDTHTGIFTQAYQQVVRPWVSYQANKHLRLSLSPLGWWGTWRPSGDKRTTFEPEMRITTQALMAYPLGRVILEQRLRYEFRFFGNKLLTDGSQGKDYYSNFLDSDTRKGRFRYMTRIFVPLNHFKMEAQTLYFVSSNEIMLGVGHNILHEKIFDQNRLYAGLGYKASPEFRFEVGYVNQIVPQKRLADGSKNTDMNHVLQLNVVIDDFPKIFRKL